MPIHATVQTFFSRYPTKLYKKSEVLIQAGDRAPAYYIINGLVVQYDIAKNGTKLILNTYKPGSFISLAGIVNDIASPFFFEATKPTTVQVAPARDTAVFLQDNPAITYDALMRISRGSNGLMLRLARAMEGSAESRILQELSIMQQRFFTGSSVIEVSETELATNTGLARETVSRTLKKLAADGIISTRRGQVSLSETFHI